jgi:hypothetical protein
MPGYAGGARVSLLHGKRNSLAPPAYPGIVRDFELPGNSWQIRQVAGV